MRGSVIAQRELAAKSSVRLTAIVRLELSRKRPRISTVRILAEALGVEPGELVSEENSAGNYL